VNKDKLKLIIQKNLPVPVQDWLKSQWQIYRHRPPIGRVNWGNLRRVQPISRRWNDRGQPIDRYYIENFLIQHAEEIRGRVLEIGEDTYTRKFGGDRVIQCDVLHVKEGNPKATIVDDLAKGDSIPSETFDCFILMQTLQYVYDLQSAMKTIYRLLKPGGTVLATLPNITPLIDPNWNDCWYWGFTTLSAQRLFEEVFPKENLTVETHGNVMPAIAFLEGISTQELKPEELDYNDSSYQVLITVRAVKPEVSS
jgi:SAM-dependent methyltransferase